MKKMTKRIIALLLIAMLSCTMLAACGDSSSDAISGTWKQTDEVNGDWTWKFNGGKAHLTGDTTGFESDGTYTLDEAAQKVTVTLENWSDPIEYTYTLDGDNLTLDSTYSTYKLVKQ